MSLSADSPGECCEPTSIARWESIRQHRSALSCGYWTILPNSLLGRGGYLPSRCSSRKVSCYFVAGAEVRIACHLCLLQASLWSYVRPITLGNAMQAVGAIGY